MSDVQFPMQPLSALTTAIKDGTHGTHRRVAEGVPLLSAKNITANGDIAFDDTDDLISESEYLDLTRLFQLEPDDLLLTIVGSLGRRAIYSGQRITFQRSVAYIRPQQQKLRSRFLFHWMGHPAFSAELARRSNATAQAGVYLGELAKVSVPVAEIQEQNTVAQVLDTLDTTIHETEAIIDKLKAVKQGLLHDLLTRGIDANGELRPPRAEAPHLYKPSPLGWIPQAWDVKAISEVAEVSSGATPSREQANRYFAARGTPWVKTLDLNEGVIFATDECITATAIRETSCCLLAEGTVLVAMYGGWEQIGRTALLAVRAVTNQAISALTFRSSSIVPEFVLRALQHGRPRWRRVAASTRKDSNITKADVLAFGVPLPEPDEQAEIVLRLRTCLDRLDFEASTLSKLRRTKAGLMDDLLTGRVQVAPLIDVDGRQDG